MKKIFERKIYQEIKNEINSEEIILLIWSRQVWKSSILKKIYNEEIDQDYSVFLNADLDLDLLNIKNAKDFLLKLKGFWYKKDEERIFFVFLDEFQKIENIWTTIKWIYDTYDNIKFFLSWSSSILINEAFWDSMMWRKITYHINRLDFEEYLLFSGDNKKLKIFNNIDSETPMLTIRDEFLNDFENFCIFWWYPKIITENNVIKKNKFLEEIYQSYLNKDIKDFFNLEHYKNIKKFLTYLTQINTSNLKINQIANDLWISNYNLSKYLNIIEWTFFVSLLEPFFTNKIKSISKSNELFFSDTWIYNFLLKNFNWLNERVDKWVIIENTVYNEIYKNLWILDELFFYRDKNQLEVDLILKSNWRIIPIEIKSWKFEKIPANLKNFCWKNNLDFAILINKEKFWIEEKDWLKILFLPYFLSCKLKNFI